MRFFDFLFALFGVVLLSPIMLLVVIIGYLDSGSPVFKQIRVGKNQKPFTLIKFRTMSVGTISVASHLADKESITKFGQFLRKSKIDELPQLINVIKGEMSLVGPRPNLFEQYELIEYREKNGVYNVLPGITGLSQVMNIDMSSPELLATTDRAMIEDLTLSKYFKYILATVTGAGRGDAIK